MDVMAESELDIRDATVLVVDDEQAVAETIGDAMSTTGTRVLCFSQFAKAVDHIHDATISIDAAIVNIRLRGGWGLDIVDRLWRRPVPCASTVVGLAPSEQLRVSLAAGAVMFLRKPLEHRALRNAVSRTIMRTREVRLWLAQADHRMWPGSELPSLKVAESLDPEILAAVGGRFDLDSRECDVAWLVTQGLRDKQIATNLGLSLPTVKHVGQRLRQKIGVSSRAGLAWAVQRAVQTRSVS